MVARRRYLILKRFSIGLLATIASACSPMRPHSPLVPSQISPTEHRAPFHPAAPTLRSEVIETLPQKERKVGTGEQTCELGVLRVESPEASFSREHETVRVRFNAVIGDSVHKLDLFGQVGDEGVAVLLPVDGDGSRKFRARAFCLTITDERFTCDEMFIDIYTRLNGHCLTEQVEVGAISSDPPKTERAEERPASPTELSPAEAGKVEIEPLTDDDTEEFSDGGMNVTDDPEHADLPKPAGRFVGLPGRVTELFEIETPREWLSPPPIDPNTADWDPRDRQARRTEQPRAKEKIEETKDAPPPTPPTTPPAPKTIVATPRNDLNTPSNGDKTTRPDRVKVQTRVQAIGCYASGIRDPQRPNIPCRGGQLLNATALPLDSKNIHVLRPERNAYFGTDLMISFLDRLSKAVLTLIPDYRLQVGDLSRKNGGAFSPHRSHQNGLDADIGYLVRHPQPKNFVKIVSSKGSLDTSQVLVHEQWDVFKKVVATGLVSQIFVNGGVKAGFCAHAKATGELDSASETLRRLSKESGHASHWHLRLKCPGSESNIDEANSRCRNETPPTKLGC